MSARIHQFPNRPSGYGGSASGPSPQARLIAAAGYGVIGWLLLVMPGMGGINVMLLAAILYWAFVHNRRTSTSYFLRYHLLQAIIGFLFLFTAFIMLVYGGRFLKELLTLFFLTDLAGWIELGLAVVTPYLYLGGFGGFGLFGVVSSLIGKEPDVPFISRQVRHWA